MIASKEFKYRQVNLTAMVLLPLWLAACTMPVVTPENDVREVAPQRWSTNAQSVETIEPAEFWAQWNDATLLDLVERVQKSSPQVESALANLRQARASIQSTNATLWPSASIGVNTQSTRAKGTTENSYKANLSGSWDINLAGASYARYDAAIYNARSKAWALEAVKDQLIAQVATAYINLRAAQEKEALIKETLLSYEETAKLATWKAEAGLGDLADAETARVQVKSAEVSLYQIQKSIAEYKNVIARLIAVPNDQLPIPEVGKIPTVQQGLAVNIPASTMMQRPDIRQTIESLYSAAKGVQAAEADFFPTLSLSGSIGTQAATVSALGASGTGVGALAAALSMPILNWGSFNAAKESAQASLDLAKANYRGTLVTALEETDNALWAVKTTETSQKTMQEAVEHAKTAWQLAKLQYESGLGDYTQLLTTERNYLSTQESEINNRASMSNAYATLYRVLGGAWKARELSTEITK